MKCVNRDVWPRWGFWAYVSLKMCKNALPEPNKGRLRRIDPYLLQP